MMNDLLEYNCHIRYYFDWMFSPVYDFIIVIGLKKKTLYTCMLGPKIKWVVIVTCDC